MTFSTHNDPDRSAGLTDAEKTLRVIATLPAPEGIEERVKSGLHAAPRQGSVISWPPMAANGARWTQLAALRAAAAAAIVVVVAGGAWEVYAHIRVAPEPAAVAAPEHLGGTGGLSTAGAVRKPQTLEGPVVAVPANVKPRSDEGNGAVLPKAHVARPAAEKNKTSPPNQR